MSEDPIRLQLESLARVVDRRLFLKRVFRVGMAGALGMALGSIDLARTYANMQNCKGCDYPPVGPGGVSCGSKGYTCPSAGGCPSGCKVCKYPGGTCPSSCGYDDGNWWVWGCGPTGMGAVICYDCQCPSTSTYCNGLCGCRSSCICCHCTTPQELAQEVLRVSAAA
jgi:hypothetical protein